MADGLTFERLRKDLAGRYRLDGELGQGGSATVYRAFDQKHGREVAVKLLRTDLFSSTARERFLREIEIAAQLQHPHIVPLLDSGEAAGSVYLVMPLLEGETLRARLARSGALPLTEAIRILVDLADALGYAHRHGVAHRDVKPDNVMLAGRHALVMDFGVAKALHAPATDRQLTGAIAIGTPSYMAPEQAMASPATDHRADLYALGVVGYEMLTGMPPFTGATPQDVLTAHVVLSPEPIRSRQPAVPEAVAAVIDRCLAKAPADRWQSAAEILQRLDPFATPTGLAVPASGRPRRWAPWVAALIGVVAVVTFTWDAVQRRGALEAPIIRPNQLSFLGTVKEASLSPDGTLLAYVTAEAEGQRLMVEDTRAAGRPVQVAASERIVGVTWTNAGASLSFGEGAADAPKTRIVPRLGGTASIVGEGRGLVSPNGERVLIATGADPIVVVLTARTNDTLRLRRPAGGWMSGIAWAPGSDRLALTVVAGDKSLSTLWLLELDGRAAQLVADSQELSAPTWSPDGRQLYFLAASGQGSDLLRLTIGRNQPTLLLAGLPVLQDSRRQPTGTFLSLGAEGRRLVFVAEEKWSNLAQFQLGASAASLVGPKLFTMGTALYSAPRLSPDGKRIAVFVSTARGAALGTVEVDGNVITELTVAPMGGFLAWSPEGQALAYTTRTADSGLRLAVHRIGVAEPTRTAAGVGFEVAWGRGGIVAQRPGNGGLTLFDPQGALAARGLATDTTTTVYSPRVAPDGLSVAVLMYQGTSGPVSLGLLSVADGTYRMVLPGAYRPIGWSADGATIFAARNSFAPAPEQLMAVPIDGRPPRILATLPPGYTGEDLSADGRLLIAIQLQTRSDIQGVELPSR